MTVNKMETLLKVAPLFLNSEIKIRAKEHTSLAFLSQFFERAGLNSFYKDGPK